MLGRGAVRSRAHRTDFSSLRNWTVIGPSLGGETKGHNCVTFPSNALTVAPQPRGRRLQRKSSIRIFLERTRSGGIMTTYTYPGVYIQELSSGVHAITGVATSIAAFVGWAPQGSMTEATLVESWFDYQTAYGGSSRAACLGIRSTSSSPTVASRPTLSA